MTWATQTANIVFAGPTSGGDAAPTFRSLVSGDLPSHTHAAADITSGTIATARLGSGSASSTTFLRGDQTYAVPDGAVTNSIGQSGFNGASDDFNDLDSTYRLVDFGDTNMEIEVPGAGTFRIEAHVQFGGDTSSADNLEAKFNGVTDSERATSINSNGWAQIILCAYVTQASTTTYQVYAKTLSTSTNWGSRYGSWIAYAKQY